MSFAEKAIITALCMVYKDNQILLQDKVSGWVGLTFPGGHIEKEESIILGIKREVLEETGLVIHNLKFCGIKQFQTENDERYIVMLFKTNEFEGELVSSIEGNMAWFNRSELNENNTAKGFLDTLEMIDDESLSEMIYNKERVDGEYKWTLEYH